MAHQVVQRVVQRAQIRVNLLRQVAGQKAEAFAGLDRRAGQDDALDQIALESIDRTGHREIGLAGASRADAERDVMFLNRLQVSDLAWCAAVQLGLAGDQLRAIHRAFGLARNAAHRGVAHFDQAELDFIDRQRLAGHAIEVLEGLRGQPGFFAKNRKPLVAALDDHIKAGFDLADVFIQRTTQVGQQHVVDRCQRNIHRLALRCRLGGSPCLQATSLFG